MNQIKFVQEKNLKPNHMIEINNLVMSIVAEYTGCKGNWLKHYLKS